MSNEMQKHDDSITETIPIFENKYVKELFDVLNRCDKDTSGLTSLLNYVNGMDDLVKRMENTITGMKAQLDTVTEAQGKPLKTFLTNVIALLEKKLAAIKKHLSAIKTQIIENCKKTVTAFKETGISALSNMASFFKIKDMFIRLTKDIDAEISANNKSIAKIEAFSNEYHAAGSHIKNMARVAVGKEPNSKVKEVGFLSKAIAYPFIANNEAMKDMREMSVRATVALDKMEAKQAEKKAERSQGKKPSLMKNLAEKKELVEQIKREAPMPQRMKPQGIEI
ncbi:MAG: hypothetical protein FWD38_12035 [Oscillospiraceae bacterium]|nr:hypothetical protein [Oscillospiraceae bacterium]